MLPAAPSPPTPAKLALGLRSRLLRYGLAAVNIGLAAAMLWPLQPLLRNGASPPLLLAVAITALVGGIGPGLLAVILAALVANYWFYPPFGHFANESTEDIVRQLLFLAGAVPLAVLGGAFRHARARGQKEAAAVRESEARLRASEERYRAFLDQTAEGIWRFEVDEPIATTLAEDEQITLFYARVFLAECNEATARMYGFTSAQELIGARLADLLPRADPRNVAFLRSFIRAGYRLLDAESHERERTGTARYFLNNLLGIVHGGYLHRAWGSQRDITERKAADDALRHSEARYRASETRLRRVLESDMIGIAFWDGERVSEANDAFLRLLGYTRSDVAAGRLRHGSLTPPEHEAADRRATEEVMARGACTPYEKEFFRQDGSRVPVLAGGALLDGNRRDGVFFVLDLTERRRAEEQLQAAQRLDTAGRLAGGIAHEANNQMSVVLGAAHFLLQRPEIQADVRQDLEHIQRAAEHTAAITKQLLAFSRRQILQPRPLDLNTEIQALEPVVRRTLGPQSTLVLDLAPALKPVRADPGQLSQVLLNLIFNARDAMPGGGALTIETAGTVLGGDDEATPSALGEPALQGAYAILTVSDTGHGMSRETVSRVFEPFFTTKPVGEGTGLGLSTVHGIVRQSNGSISVDSAPGRGTTFRIYLPQTTLDVTPPSSPPPTASHPASGTILVVDDQPQVRAMLVRALQEEGYTVLAAGSATEALAVATRDGIQLDLVVTDLLMPDMTGGELATQLQECCPGLAVLFTSGHPDEEMRQRGLLDADQPFLQKPYAPEVLAAQVSQLLEKRRPS